MPRRGRVIKREAPPDLKYGSKLVSGFINRVMRCGKKSTAERIVYQALELVEKEVKEEPANVLEQAIKNATPLLQVKSRRVGGATYQVPVEVRPERGLSLAIRWLIKSTKERKGKSMAEKLAAEILDASQGRGVTIKKRDDTHKMAEANKAFAHYRW
jgi:small subunit ribosomal protein S7